MLMSSSAFAEKPIASPANMYAIQRMVFIETTSVVMVTYYV